MEGIPYRQKKVWIEPVVLFLVAVGIWLGRGAVIISHFKLLPLWGWYLVDLTCYGLALYAIGKGAWLAFRSLGFGVSLLAVGIAIMFYNWCWGEGYSGIIVGGFLAVVGAVLVVGRRNRNFFTGDNRGNREEGTNQRRDASSTLLNVDTDERT